MVGPQKLESIQQIALLTENEDMFENAEEYFDACRIIRSVRVMIRKQIGQAIIDKISGKGSSPHQTCSPGRESAGHCQSRTAPWCPAQPVQYQPAPLYPPGSHPESAPVPSAPSRPSRRKDRPTNSWNPSGKA